VKVSKLRRGERIAAIAAILLLAAMFLPWFGHASAVERASQEVGFSVGSPELTRTAWEDFEFTDIVMALGAVAALALAVLRMRGAEAKAASGLSRAVTGFASLGLLLVLFTLISPPGDGSPRAGWYAGVALLGALAIGGYFSMGDQGLLERRPRSRRTPALRPRKGT